MTVVPVLVVGMHRSGTSTLTRLIESMGVYAGAESDFHPPTKHDVEGHREHIAFWRADEDALHAIGRSWDDPTPCDWHTLDEPTRAAVCDAMLAAVGQMPPGLWVAKDPRMCLTLPLWREVLATDPLIVHIHRDPLEVAASLALRDQLPRALSLAMWEVYQRSALTAMAGLNAVFVSFAELLQNPALVAERIGHAIRSVDPAFTAQMSAMPVSEARRRSVGDPADRRLVLTASQSELVELLDRFAAEPGPRLVAAGIAPRNRFADDTLAEFATLRRELHAATDRERGLRDEAGDLRAQLGAEKRWRSVGQMATVNAGGFASDPPLDGSAGYTCVTIIARNYTSRARVLAESFQRHHPGSRTVTMIVDGEDSDRNIVGLGEVLFPDDLGLDRREWRAMAAIYDVTEFATALKPATLRHLATRGDSRAVMYLDPDIEVFASLHDVFTTAEAGAICLTPHALAPYPRDGLTPDEKVLRHAGVFNLGFIAVSSAAVNFLHWWHERLMTESLVDLPNALFTDQRWIDFVPTLFRCEVLRDPGLNVAYWNLHERSLRREADHTITAAGAPLRFFHYSGFDPNQPDVLSIHAGGAPRATLQCDVLRSLVAHYSDAISRNAIDGGRAASYRFATAANGMSMSPLIRRTIRRAWIENGLDALADPFDVADRDAFPRWLCQNTVGPDDTEIARWEHELYLSRGDLQHAFPDLDGPSAYDFRLWLQRDPTALEIRRSTGLAPAAEPLDDPRLHLRDPSGWNVVGYLSDQFGVAEACRRMLRAIEFTGVQVEPIGVKPPGLRSGGEPRSVRSMLRFANSLYCVNADETQRVVRLLEPGPRHQSGRRIGLWFWEVDVFPERFVHAFHHLDEVWVTSEFIRSAIAPRSPIPVRVVPLALAPPMAPTLITRAQLGLTEATTFFCPFDFKSIVNRKNPASTIDAFCRAFSPTDGARLIIKSINGSYNRDQLAALRKRAGGRGDIDFIDEHWSSTRMQATVELVDCVVSLHRSEGFGLNLAHAMSVGTPVIATGYSGNLAFMSEQTAQLVPYELIEVGHGHGPYPPESRWADPNICAAAEAMRAVRDEPDRVRRMAQLGKRTVTERLNARSIASDLRPLLAGAAGMPPDLEGPQ